jgi:hypothetical protein
MYLQVSEHRIGHLADHHAFKRACYGDKKKNKDNPESYERGRKQRPSLVSQKISNSDFK